jgi:hypothetical protein
MKKIICLFLMATTLSLASAPAMVKERVAELTNSQSVHGHERIETPVNEQILENIYGMLPDPSGIFGFLCGGTIMMAFAFGGPAGIAIGAVLGGVSCGVGLFI